MNDSMASRANGDKVAYRVNLVTAPDRRNGNYVMNVDKTISDLPESFTEIYPANLAPVAVVGDASGPCQRIAFIGIHDHLAFCPLGKRAASHGSG